MIRQLMAVLLVVAPSVLQASDYEIILESYGEPVLVAGAGQLEDVNGWQVSMEGTNALEAELSNTHMTMADAYGNLYLADKQSHSILKISPDGTIRTVVGTNAAGNGGDARQLGTAVALSNPNGLYTLRDGTTYILDRDNNKIRKLETDGYVTTVVTNTLRLNVGRGLWVSPNEDLIYFTATDTVRKWTPGAGVTTYASGFLQLGNIDVDPRDNCLVVTDRNAHRVYKVFDGGGREVIAGDGTTSKHGSGGAATNAGLDMVRGVAFLPNGGYFLATQGDGDIWYVDTNGIAREFISGSGSSTTLPHDGICEPRAVSVAPWGDLIITENDYAVVRIAPWSPVVCEVSLQDADTLGLTWSSMPAVTCRVDVAESLLSPNWQVLAETTGASFALTTSISSTGVASRACAFYRIVSESY